MPAADGPGEVELARTRQWVSGKPERGQAQGSKGPPHRKSDGVARLANGGKSQEPRIIVRDWPRSVWVTNGSKPASPPNKKIGATTMRTTGGAPPAGTLGDPKAGAKLRRVKSQWRRRGVTTPARPREARCTDSGTWSGRKKTAMHDPWRTASKRTAWCARRRSENPQGPRPAQLIEGRRFSGIGSCSTGRKAEVGRSGGWLPRTTRRDRRASKGKEPQERRPNCSAGAWARSAHAKAGKQIGPAFTRLIRKDVRRAMRIGR